MDPIWLHVGLHYLKPFRSTLQVLSHVRDLQGGTTVLQQTQQFYSDLRLFASLCLALDWHISCYRVLSTALPLARLLPSQCHVQRFGPQSVELKKPVRRRGRPAGSRSRVPRTFEEEGQQRSGSALATGPQHHRVSSLAKRSPVMKMR